MSHDNDWGRKRGKNFTFFDLGRVDGVLYLYQSFIGQADPYAKNAERQQSKSRKRYRLAVSPAVSLHQLFLATQAWWKVVAAVLLQGGILAYLGVLLKINHTPFVTNYLSIPAFLSFASYLSRLSNYIKLPNKRTSNWSNYIFPKPRKPVRKFLCPLCTASVLKLGG